MTLLRLHPGPAEYCCITPRRLYRWVFRVKLGDRWQCRRCLLWWECRLVGAPGSAVYGWVLVPKDASWKGYRLSYSEEHTLEEKELRTLRGVVLQIHLIQQDRRSTGGPPVHVNARLTAASVQYDVPPSSLYPEGSHVALDPLQAGVLAASEQIREEQRMERAAHDIAEARCFHLLGPPPCAGCLEQTRRDLDATIKAYQEQEHHGAPA